MLAINPFIHHVMPKRPATFFELMADAMDTAMDEDHASGPLLQYAHAGNPLLQYFSKTIPCPGRKCGPIKRQRIRNGFFLDNGFCLDTNENSYTLTLEAPGLRSEDVSISIDGDVIKVNGETKNERCHVSIARAVRLPVDADRNPQTIVTAHNDGIISIKMARKSAAAPRTLAIDSAPKAPLNQTAMEEDDSTDGPTHKAAGESAVENNLKGDTTSMENQLENKMEDKGHTFVFAAPGVKSADLSVTIEDGVLKLSGQSKGVTHREALAQIHRELRLPSDADVESEHVAVTHQDGLISIYVPRKMPVKLQLGLTSGQTKSKL